MNPKCCNQESKLIEQRTFSFFYCEKCRKEVPESIEYGLTGAFEAHDLEIRIGYVPKSNSPTPLTPQVPAFQLPAWAVVGAKCYRAPDLISTPTEYTVESVGKDSIAVSCIEPIFKRKTVVVWCQQTFASNFSPLPAWVVVGAKCFLNGSSIEYEIDGIGNGVITVCHRGTSQYTPYFRGDFLSYFSPQP